MKLPRREFLTNTAALAGAACLSAELTRAAEGANAYPYLGRTEKYVDFRIIDPGRTITKVEWQAQGQTGLRVGRRQGDRVPGVRVQHETRHLARRRSCAAGSPAG